VQDPELRLKEQGIAPRCFLHSDRAAVLDPAHRARVGNDLFYFSTASVRAEFVRHPLRYVARLSDPVTHVRFHPTSRSPRADHDGLAFYFADRASRLVFVADPDSFAGMHNGMLPMTAGR
jgi:YHS domain-containing protein